MPVEEVFDLDLESNLNNLDKLDRVANKTTKQLEKERKALEKAQKIRQGKGVFPGPSEPNLPSGSGPARDLQPLSKRDQKIEKNIRKLEEKIRKDQVKNFGDKGGFLQGILGKKGAKNLFDFGRAPGAKILGLMKGLPILGGVFAAKEIADFVIDELVKLDAFFKAFVDIITNRENRFRDLQTQARVAAGLQQDIITTADGSVDPRESYNTFNIFEKNQIEIEEKYQLQDTSGVE